MVDFWKQGWFWGMVIVGAGVSLAGRSLWAEFVNPATATAVGDFLMFSVILGVMASKAPSEPPPLARRIPAVLISAAVGAGIMSILRGSLLG